jgi:thiol-disulfide isomerase/thioredoxin
MRAGGDKPGRPVPTREAPMTWRHFTAIVLGLVFVSSCSPSGTDPRQGPRPGPATTAARKPATAAGPAPRAKEAVPDPATPDGLVARAEQVAAGGDLDESSRLLEKALALQPDHRQALFTLARVAHIRGYESDRAVRGPLYIQSAEAIRKLRDSYKDLSTQERAVIAPLVYDEACTLALEGQPEKALDRLAEAIDAGLEDPDMVKADDDLASLRKLPRYAELIRKLEQGDRERATRNAKALLAENTPFPFRFELPDVDGKRVTLDDLKGDVILVDFWGTWCPPCRKEIPVYKQLLAKYRERGLTIVGINYERVPDAYVRPTVRQFVAEQGVPFLCLIGDDTTRDQIPDFVGYPTTLFLDRARKVRARVAGYHSFTALEAIIAQLLEESSRGQEPLR